MKIMRKGQRIYHEEYGIFFEWKDKPGGGFSFDCDKEGNLLMDQISQGAEESLKKCLSGEYDVISKGVKTYYLSYFQPARGRCDCGKELDLPDFTNVCDCGRYYNSCGKSLNPPSMWEEPEYDDDPGGAWDFDENEILSY